MTTEEIGAVAVDYQDYSQIDSINEPDDCADCIDPHPLDPATEQAIRRLTNVDSDDEDDAGFSIVSRDPLDEISSAHEKRINNRLQDFMLRDSLKEKPGLQHVFPLNTDSPESERDSVSPDGFIINVPTRNTHSPLLYPSSTPEYATRAASVISRLANLANMKSTDVPESMVVDSAYDNLGRVPFQFAPNDIVFDDEPLMFNRLGSHEVIYGSHPLKPPKIVAKHLMGNLLGEGSYGKVKDALACDTLQRRAVKILKKRNLRKIPCGEANVKRYFVQLIYGLEYLLCESVVHKDIKPGNLLISLNNTLKISDFGVAEPLSRYELDCQLGGGQGTPSFQPPEIAGGMHDNNCSFPVDVWAAGVTLYNAVSGCYPFEGDNIYRIFDNICNKQLVMPPNIELDLMMQDLLTNLLCKCPFKRITIAQILHHDWITKKHPHMLDEVSLPSQDNAFRELTVMPYLAQLYDQEPPPGCEDDDRRPINFGHMDITHDDMIHPYHNIDRDMHRGLPRSDSEPTTSRVNRDLDGSSLDTIVNQDTPTGDPRLSQSAAATASRLSQARKNLPSSLNAMTSNFRQKGNSFCRQQ